MAANYKPTLQSITMHTYIFQNYKIKYEHKEGSALFSATKTSSQTQYTIKYLKFNTTYTFEVRALFKDNKLSDAVSIQKTTGPFSAPVGPLKPILHADRSVTLFWSAPPTIEPRQVVRSSFLFVCFSK